MNLDFHQSPCIIINSILQQLSYGLIILTKTQSVNTVVSNETSHHFSYFVDAINPNDHFFNTRGCFCTDSVRDILYRALRGLSFALFYRLTAPLRHRDFRTQVAITKEKANI